MIFSHRENIFIHQEQWVKISGLTLFSNRKYHAQFPKVPFSGGSPEYWSPEQANHYQILKGEVNTLHNYATSFETLSNLTEKVYGDLLYAP